MKFLVVDDTRIILSVIEAILTQNHQDVFTADNGRAGYAAFYDILPDIVITDIEMPWQDGLSMMQSIRQTHPDIPTIYMTGNPAPYQRRLDDEQRAYAAGIVHKPFTRADLLRAVTEIRALSARKPHRLMDPLRAEGPTACNPKPHCMASLSAARFQPEHRYEKINGLFSGDDNFAGRHAGRLG
jgi:CheY-like chemotaxis protein